MPRKKSSRAYQARQAYRQDTLAAICTLPEHKFGRAFGMETVEVPQKWQPDGYYHFRDNGASVLAVAHLDTVVRREHRRVRFGATQAGPYVISGSLDDRLGAYVILKLLPALGITTDWLLTVGEESGQSTAEHFKPPKDYDWVIEFDRAGTDVVMYQYEDEASCVAVEASGATMGKGSFSDIAYLEHLGIKAFNWGVGYRGNYHSEKGYAFLSDTFTMVGRYLRFHEQNAGTAMPHEPRSYDDWDRDDSTLTCNVCYALAAVDTGTGTCMDCDCCQGCGMNATYCMCYAKHALSGKPVSSDNDNNDEDEDDALAGEPAAARLIL